MRSEARPNASHRAVAGALFVVFLAAAFLATRPLSVDFQTRLPNNADGLVFAWTLKQMCGGLAQPLDPFRGNMFHPDEASLLYTEPLLGLAIQVAPLCALDLDHVTLYNLTYILALALGALGAFLLAREITGSAPAALVGAVVFAFTTANYDSAARLQIVASYATPFCLLYIIRFCRHGRWKDAILMGAAFALQSLTCTYFEIFLAILLILSVPSWIGLAGGMAVARERLPRAAAGALLAVVLVLPVNLAQRLHLDPVLASRPQAQQISLSFFADVLPTNLIYGDVLGRARLAYDALYFPGLLPIALALVFVFITLRGKGDGALNEAGLKPVVFIGVTAFVFAFGTVVETRWGEMPGPLSLFTAVPGLGQARVPSRFLMFSRLALAVLASAGALMILRRFARGQWVAASVIAAGCFIEHWSVPLDTWVTPTRAQLPEVYRWIGDARPSLGPILEFPPSLQRLRREEATWLHTAAIHGIPMANGFSSFRPAWHEFVMEAALRWPDERLMTILEELGVRTIIVHPRPRGIAEVDDAVKQLLDYAAAHPERLRLLKSFDDAPRLEGLWSRLGEESVFEVQPAAASRTLPPSSPPISRTGWTCRSTEADCERTLDGDPRTLLLGREAQGAGRFLKIMFPQPIRIGAVSIGLGRTPEYFPREPVIRVLRGGVWEVVEAELDVRGMLREMKQGSTNPAMLWRFAETEASGFEIRTRGGGHGFRPLGIPEVNAHAASGS